MGPRPAVGTTQRSQPTGPCLPPGDSDNPADLEQLWSARDAAGVAQRSGGTNPSPSGALAREQPAAEPPLSKPLVPAPCPSPWAELRPGASRATAQPPSQLAQFFVTLATSFVTARRG